MPIHSIFDIKVGGVCYRGPFPPQNQAGVWKINAYLPSSKKSTSGLKVGASWQTWKKFTGQKEAWEEIQRLKRAALTERGA